MVLARSKNLNNFIVFKYISSEQKVIKLNDNVKLMYISHLTHFYANISTKNYKMDCFSRKIIFLVHFSQIVAQNGNALKFVQILYKMFWNHYLTLTYTI